MRAGLTAATGLRRERERDRLREPLAVERLRQDLVHAGGEAGLAVFT